MHPTCPQQPLLPAKIPTFNMWLSGRGSGKWGPGWTFKGIHSLGWGPCVWGQGLLKGLFSPHEPQVRGLCGLSRCYSSESIGCSRMGTPGETSADCCRPEWVEGDQHRLQATASFGHRWPLPPPDGQGNVTTCLAPVDAWHQSAFVHSDTRRVSEAPELNATKHPPCIISLSVPLQKRRPDWINSGSMQGNCFLNLWRHPQWTFKGGFIIYKHHGALYPSSNYQTKSFTKFHYTYILLVYPYLGINPLPELMNASWSEYVIGKKKKEKKNLRSYRVWSNTQIWWVLSIYYSVGHECGVIPSLDNDACLHLHHDQTITPEFEEAAHNHWCVACLTSCRWKALPLSAVITCNNDSKPKAFPTIWNHLKYSLDLYFGALSLLWNIWSLTHLLRKLLSANIFT